MKFVCENCGKKFDQGEECKNHENSCPSTKKSYVYLKYIKVYPEIDDREVDVYEYPKATKARENYYFLNEYYDVMYEPEFDTIRITDDEVPSFYIVTENLDPIYEKECITKLLNYKLTKAKEEYVKLGEYIKNFSTSDYLVGRATI
jgi:hypothetical protein